MGRITPSITTQPPALRRDARAKRAKATINKDIPSLLQAYPRAKKGVEETELIVDPGSIIIEHDRRTSVANATLQNQTPDQDRAGDESKRTSFHPNTKQTNVTTTNLAVFNSQRAILKPSIQIRAVDTLQAAADLLRSDQALSTNKPKPKSKSRSHIQRRTAILNMCSPLRPGGGFLTGATSQEESLCMRTTLYPSLRDSFYRLPDVGAIYTPDVLCFRSHDPSASDLPKPDRFFVDVISSSMIRNPDVSDGEYASGKDRVIVETKMRAVLRVARQKRVTKLVLGAWGCGAFGSPVGEVARAWRRAILGTSKQNVRRHESEDAQIERFDDIHIVFAIKEPRMAAEFAQVFGENSDIDVDIDIDVDQDMEDEGAEKVDGESEASKSELNSKIAELEEQINATRSEAQRDMLRGILATLKDSSLQNDAP